MHRDRPAVQGMRTPASAGGGEGGAEQACREGPAGGAHLMREAIKRNPSQSIDCRHAARGWAGGNQGRSREIEGDRGRSHRLLQLEHATGLGIARLMRETLNDVIRGPQRSSEVLRGHQRRLGITRN